MRQHRLMGWGCILLLTACSEALPPEIDPGEAQPGQAIKVGGVVMPGLSVQVETKALEETPAEQVSWLKTPLSEGLDVFYGLRESYHTSKKNAKLKWGESGGTGEYTFHYAGTTNPAQWLGNGSHLFRGVYVPKAVRATAGDTPPAKRPWVKDQSPEAAERSTATTNYDHLNHYLAMRANLQIAATLGRIQLPYSHRLARVITVVLIDPELSKEEGKTVTLEGYELIDGKDNPQSTSIRMDRVEVLDYVSSSATARAEEAVTMWYPRWTTARNVTPHFFGVMGSLDKDFKEQYTDLLVFRDTKTDNLYFPTTDGWNAMRNTYNASYIKYKDQYPDQAKLEAQIKKETGLTCINYGKAPCYDLILRPTYTSEAMVMYDEAENIDLGTTRKELAALTNGITYVVELSNGLRYSKRIEIDLDAGYQTVVYLRIDREQVDFNQTVAEEWRMVTEADGYYGVNNQHGDRLSIAGGSWQRAYRVGNLDVPITDGSEYNENGNPDHYQKPEGEQRDGQYLSEVSWKEAFFAATEGGKHHGDYFVLTQDITIDVSTIPTDFVFTGHLDGRGHTITLTGTRPSDSGSTGGGTEEGGTTPGEGGSSAGTGSAGSTTPGEGNALSEEGGSSAGTGGSSAGTGTEGAGTEGSGTTGSTEGSGSTGSGSTGTGSESGSTGGGSTGGSEGSGSTGGSSGETGGGSEAGGTTPKPVRYLFDGLNGTYEATAGTANVHNENGTLVPLMGYRAELMNVTIKGGHLFNPDATTTTGYVVGCSDESKQPIDRNPGLGGSD